ncbi:MAG: hypothetical protein GH144_01435 [Clostridia bacterium]|jgi:hypothetical protein|nr:hypothetical protein [Clostridia bacterium]
MNKHRNIGVVTPNIKLEAVFYEEGKLTRDPVIALLVVEYTDDEGKESVDTQPLVFNKQFGAIWEAMNIGSYLGMEAEGTEKDWTEETKEIDEFDATHNK